MADQQVPAGTNLRGAVGVAGGGVQALAGKLVPDRAYRPRERAGMGSALPSPQPRVGPVRVWLLAARPATLPAAITPVLVGSAAAAGSGHFRPAAFVVALVASMLI